MRSIPFVEFGQKSNYVMEKFETLIPGGVGVPHVVIAATGDNNMFEIISENAGHHINEHGADGFPWSDEAVQEKIAKEEHFREEIKSKQRNLEFLTLSEQCSVYKHNEEVPLEVVRP